jgi:uncharacterized membrane protein YfcA
MPAKDHTSSQRQAFMFAGLCLVIGLVVVAIFEPQVLQTPGVAARTLVNRVRGTSSGGTSMGTVLTLLAMSFSAGIIGGMLGMGGGVLKVAGLLILFKLDIYFARAVSVGAMFFMSLSALPSYMKKDMVLWPLVIHTFIPSVFGILVGILLGNYLGGTVLTHMFGFFVIFLSFTTMGQTFLDPNETTLDAEFSKGAPMTAGRKGVLYFIGSMHGFLCGLFGISGGIHTIPAQQVFLGIPIRNSIANTLAVSTLCAGVGCILVTIIGVNHGDFSVSQILVAFLCVAVGAFAGARIGTSLADRLNTHVMRILVEVIGLVAGFALVF